MTCARESSRTGGTCDQISPSTTMSSAATSMSSAATSARSLTIRSASLQSNCLPSNPRPNFRSRPSRGAQDLGARGLRVFEPTPERGRAHRDSQTNPRPNFRSLPTECVQNQHREPPKAFSPIEPETQLPFTSDPMRSKQSHLTPNPTAKTRPTGTKWRHEKNP